jgi:CBS domain-containing protein
MNRKDAHLDAMLRYLGAAYYGSLHGKAAPAEVARALDSVAEYVGDEGHGQVHNRGRSRVRDVMTASVVTVGPITPYKEIVRLLAGHKISGMPVVTMDRHVAGVVAEGDLVAAQSKPPAARRWWPTSWPQRHRANTAEELMTSPAITVQADATVAAAARLMSAHHVRRLPVVDSSGVLLGIVSRRDLLSVFLRPDSDIARQVGETLTALLPGGPTGIQASVRHGVVTLAGQSELAADEGLIAVAVRLAWDVEGVVDVVDQTGLAAVGHTASR